jgi:hypothetical protein
MLTQKGPENLLYSTEKLTYTVQHVQYCTTRAYSTYKNLRKHLFLYTRIRIRIKSEPSGSDRILIRNTAVHSFFRKLKPEYSFQNKVPKNRVFWLNL